MGYRESKEHGWCKKKGGRERYQRGLQHFESATCLTPARLKGLTMIRLGHGALLTPLELVFFFVLLGAAEPVQGGRHNAQYAPWRMEIGTRRVVSADTGSATTERKPTTYISGTSTVWICVKVCAISSGKRVTAGIGGRTPDADCVEELC